MMHRRPAETLQERRIARSGVLASGTLACPECDAPVDPGAAALAPADPLACPFCARTGAVRDFLSLGVPTRPARVVVRVSWAGSPA
jgi:hypothetical protein